MVAVRMRQGVRALLSWARPVDYEAAAAILSPPLLALFARMRRSEQQHSINVLRTLQARGYSDPALIAAALLHDVGKTRAAYHLWDRVLVVLVKAALPNLARRWGQGHPVGWRRPFAINLQHPQWSADMARAAGADPLVVTLIANHQQHLDHAPQSEMERLLAALQAADDAN